jgi:hypothetical protein
MIGLARLQDLRRHLLWCLEMGLLMLDTIGAMHSFKVVLLVMINDIAILGECEYCGNMV